MINRPRTSALMLALLPVMLAACAVGPDYRRPETAVPEQFLRAPEMAEAEQGDANDANLRFWRSFGDAQLSALVEQALAANRDLHAALARLDASRAVLSQTRMTQYPVVTAGAEATQSHADSDVTHGPSNSTRNYDAALHASWELDVFGRLRRLVEAQHAGAEASAHDVAALQVAVAGETARTYLQLRGLQERLRIARAGVDNQQATLTLVQARHAAGRSTRFDVARSQAQLETMAAHIPALEAQAAVALHRLAVLTGQPPHALAELQIAAPLPEAPQRIHTGTPANVLRRRPDVAAAEARLHAATASIGVASADLFPRIGLTGLLGADSRALQLGVDWSFLDVGRVRARIAESRAGAEQLLAAYQQTVLLALEETENALVRLERSRSEGERLSQAVASQQLAVRLARERYRAGTIGLHETLDAEQTLYDAEAAYSDSRTRSTTAAVAVYRALAGGWPMENEATSSR